ncbi:cilia- and flagella-associated protein 251-like [Odontomachus brunneus]|uniref:cilia- and flagella-associated protein 251-like n=1 Tax=Odontomachus brunneus TaxID=486640 RepID=UPI0013F2AC57|nr:cilia- and flagella-associated protein 251-like [Odontomachus brunneus]
MIYLRRPATMSERDPLRVLCTRSGRQLTGPPGHTGQCNREEKRICKRKICGCLERREKKTHREEERGQSDGGESIIQGSRQKERGRRMEEKRGKMEERRGKRKHGKGKKEDRRMVVEVVPYREEVIGKQGRGMREDGKE